MIASADALEKRNKIVVANDEKSDEARVIFGMLQSTVLAALLFVIMISDIDCTVKDSVVRILADDIRISREITGVEDRNALQRDDTSKTIQDRKMQSTKNLSKMALYNTGKAWRDMLISAKGKSVENIFQLIDENPKRIQVIERLIKKVCINQHISSKNNKKANMVNMLIDALGKRMPEWCNTSKMCTLEYFNVIWYPHYQKDNAKIASVQKSFTARIEVVDDLDYWERLEVLKGSIVFNYYKEMSELTGGLRIGLPSEGMYKRHVVCAKIVPSKKWLK
ncbi:uncharacterized protein [Palaemon carinicauda]|uniref:uncharacterized protein n=1 Tax=Palaemon carinicauda TaxID=392227 RepID=UPI0035B69B96